MKDTCFAGGGVCTGYPCSVCGFGATIEEKLALALAFSSQAERERDELRAELKLAEAAGPGIDGWEKYHPNCADNLETEERYQAGRQAADQELRDALSKFGRHARGCPAKAVGKPGVSAACACGWLATREKLLGR